MKKKLIIPSIILLVLIVTLISSVAFFSYAKEGNKESSIQIGDLTFKYTETSGKGHGINLDDAFPLSDQEGKTLDEYFDFKVEANLTRSDIAYRVELDTTLADLPAEGIKVYLTEIVDGNEVEINSIINTLSTYGDSTDGKVIYTEIIPRNTKNYVKNFRLRLWIDENVDWTSDSYMGHSATYKVNVNANSDGTLASDDVVTDKTTSIERVVANNKYLFTESSDTGVDLEATVPYTVDNVDIEVYESNTQATSTITPINSLSGVSSKSTSQNIHTGNNYFKVITTASNGTTQEEHILKVVKEADSRNDLLNLGVEGYSLTPSFDSEITEYTLTLEENTINIVGTSTSESAQINGLGEKTLMYGANIFTIVVLAEDQSVSPKVYTLTITNARPVAPTITGGSSEWATSRTISLATENQTAFAISGIAGYEYYKTQSTEVPTDGTSGTNLSSPYTLTVTDEGTTYVYYRTVSNKGSRSVWSSPQVVNVDNVAPTAVALSASATTPNKIKLMYTPSTARSSIKSVKCYYGTTSNPTTEITATGEDCVFGNLNANQTYYFKKCVTSNSNLTTCSAVTSLVAQNEVHDYPYNGTTGSEGSPRSLDVYSGITYQLEAWGAQGGSYSIANGGKGGYTGGWLKITNNGKLYVYVGGQGSCHSTANSPGGYNGGGSVGYQSAHRYYCSGGGATDYRLTGGNWNDFNGLKSRIMVAAGGGGAYYDDGEGYGSTNGGAAGGLTGSKGDMTSTEWDAGTGGTQTAGGYAICSNSYYCKADTGWGLAYGTPAGYGGFGYGGVSLTNVGAGGGSGYYGGGGATHLTSGGGGGSSFISGYSGCNAIASNSTSNNIIHTGQPNHYSGYVFSNASMIANYRTGHGHARIIVVAID